MSWLLSTILCTVMWGIAELFYKRGARPDENYSHLKISVFVGAVMGLHALYTILTHQVDYDFINFLYYLPVSLCYILSMTLSYFGMRFILESVSDPIENTSGGLTFLLCVLFGISEISFATKEESIISTLTVFGVLLIVIGVVGLGFLESRSPTDIKKKLGKKASVIAFAMPFCYAFIDAVGSFLDCYYLDVEEIADSPLVGATTEKELEIIANTSYELTFAAFALILFLFLTVKGERLRIKKQPDKLLAAVFETAGQYFYVFSIGGDGAIAAPIFSSSVVISLLLSRIFLKEKLTWKQYLFIGIILAGIFLLAFLDV